MQIALIICTICVRKSATWRDLLPDRCVHLSQNEELFYSFVESVLHGSGVKSVWERRFRAEQEWSVMGCLFVGWPVVPQWLRQIQILTNDASSLADYCVDPSGISGTAKKDGSRYHRRVKDLQHVAAHISFCIASKLPEKVETALLLLAHSITVGRYSILSFRWTPSYL